MLSAAKVSEPEAHSRGRGTSRQRQRSPLATSPHRSCLPCSAAPPFPFEKTGPANPIQPTDNLATEMQSWSLKVLKVVGVLERTFRIVCPPRLEAAVQTVRRAILRRACSTRGRRKLQDRASRLRCFTYAGLRS